MFMGDIYSFQLISIAGTPKTWQTFPETLKYNNKISTGNLVSTGASRIVSNNYITLIEK